MASSTYFELEFWNLSDLGFIKSPGEKTERLSSVMINHFHK